jgi:ABC-type Fe3+ transport system permease subunit
MKMVGLLIYIFILFFALLIEIWFLKFSAEKAYKRKTSWKEAFYQWIWLLGIRIIIWIIVLMLAFIFAFTLSII